MRMLVIKQESDLQALGARLLASRTGEATADAALSSLQALNPHADLAHLKPGTVLLVPNEPAFKASASSSVTGDALGELQDLVRQDLGAAATRLRTANEARASDRGDVANALKTAAVKRAAEGDPALKDQLAEATKTLKTEQQQDDAAQVALEAGTKAALAELAALSKLLG